MSVIAVDWDGTIASSLAGFAPGRYGPPVDGAVEGMRKLKKWGYSIIIWTCRGEEDDLIRAYCAENSIPFDTINEPIYQDDDLFPGFTRSPKVVADFYIDDRNPGWRGWRKALAAIAERNS